MQSRPSLSLVIPAYNEAAGIRDAVAEAEQALAKLTSDYEVLVVDDGSDDQTADLIALAVEASPRVRLLRHAGNRGYSAALRTGFEAARFDLVAFTDADSQFDLADLASLLPLADKNPVVVGYRIDRQDPATRRFASWGYNVLVRTLLGTRVRDCDCALKVFRREALAKLLPETPGFFVNTEMLTRARQLGMSVAEVGVRHRPRLRGASKVSLGDIPRTLRTLVPFWWSRVLFPQNGEPGALAPGGQRNRSNHVGHRGLTTSARLVCTSLLVLVAALLFFVRIDCPLQEPQESRYAEIPRQMLAAESWLVPVLHGQAYYDKPPLLYWLVMASYQTFGIDDSAARLPACLAGFCCVLVTFWWGGRTLGWRAGLLGAAVLCLSPRFVQLGRMLTTDSLLCLWVTASWAAAHAALGDGKIRKGWWVVSAVACGLGLLTKGPVALVLVGAPVAAYQVLDPRAARISRRAAFAWVAVALGVAAPWFVAVAGTDPGFLSYFFWLHHVERFVTPFDHEQPVWYYVPAVLVGTLPWVLLLPGLLGLLARRSPRVEARRPAALGFFLLAFLWSLAFFSLAGCKRPLYMLPMLPPLALALGAYLDAVLPRSAAALWRYHSRPAFQATALTLGLGLVGACVASRAELVRPGAGALLAGAALSALAGLVWLGRRRGAALPWAGCFAAAFLVLFAGVHQLLPGYAARFSLREPVTEQAGSDLPVFCYPRSWDSVSFYLKRNDVKHYAPDRLPELVADLEGKPGALLFLKNDRGNTALEALLRRLPPNLEFVPEKKQGAVTVGTVRRRAD